jgi:hypothetical protein
MKMSKSGKPMAKASLPSKHGKVKGKEDGRSAEEDLLMGSSTQSELSGGGDHAHRLSAGKAGRDGATKQPRIRASEDYSASLEGRTTPKRRKRPKGPSRPSVVSALDMTERERMVFERMRLKEEADNKREEDYKRLQRFSAS